MSCKRFRALIISCALTLAALAPSQQIVARNDSPKPSSRWCVVSVPNTGELPSQATFAGGPAVKLYSRKGATFYGIRPVLAPNERRVDTLELTEQAIEYAEHPDVFDCLFDLQPRLFINGQPIALRKTGLVESNAARRVYEFTFAEPGWIGKVWAYVWSGQPIVEFTALVSWADRSDPSWTTQTNAIEWRFGEAIDVPTATAEGLTVREDWNRSGILRWRVPETQTGRVLGDSEVYRFRGTLRCAKRHPWAGLAGPIPDVTPKPSAVCMDWDGHWGPFRAVAPIPENAVANAQDEADAFAAQMEKAFTMFEAPRMYGHANRAANSGHQPVFGHSPAAIAVSGHDPRQIERLLFSVSDDFMRPEHLRTEWANLLGMRNYPQLATWNMRPHWGRSRTNGERTKPTQTWPGQYSLGDDKSLGRTGRDNEHWASMVPPTYLLTGDYDLEWIMRGWAEILPTNNNVWNTNSRLVDRALGRLLRLLSWLDLCLDGRSRNLTHETMAQLVQRAHTLTTREGVIRHVGELTRGDRRGIVDNADRARTTMNVPFQSLAACGLFAASIALPESYGEKTLARSLALEVGESIVLYEMYEENGRAWAPYQLHYREGGEAIPDAERVSGSWEVKDGAPSGQGTDWLRTWAYGVLPIVAAESDNAEAVERAGRMMLTVPEARSWFDARFRGTRARN